MSTDDPLKAYLQALMKIDNGRPAERPLGREELRAVALEVGLSDAALLAAEASAHQHQARGSQFLQARNFDDAIAELEQAAVLMPYDAEASYLMAQALSQRGEQRGHSADLDRAGQYLRRTLTIDANHAGALQLQSAIAHGRQRVVGRDQKRRWKLWGALAAGAVLLLLAYFKIYNGMVALEEDVNSSWAQVENQYQRRADLVPNLVATVQGAANFQRETLREVTAARAAVSAVQLDPSSLGDTAKVAQYAAAQDRLGSALSRLLAVVEQYPNLTATENFRDLQHQLEGTENRIAVERRRFNQAVQAYNAKARRFPNNLLGFDAKAYFSTDPANATAPAVQL